MALRDGFNQRYRLQRIARTIRAFLQLAAVNPILHLSHVQARTGLSNQAVTEFDDLREVMPGINVHKLERHHCRCEGTARQFEDHHGILAAGEKQGDLIELARYLAQDVDGLIF